MNKTELISAIAAKGGLTKTDAKKALDAFVEVTKGGLKKGDKVSKSTLFKYIYHKFRVKM